MNDTVQELVNGRNYIEKNGWCRSSFFTDDGRACLVGGLIAGNFGVGTAPQGWFPDGGSDWIHDREEPGRSIEVLSRAVTDKYGEVWDFQQGDRYASGAVFRGNDRHCSSKEDALILFDRAIEKAELAA